MIICVVRLSDVRLPQRLMQRWGCTTRREAVSAHRRLRLGGGAEAQPPVEYYCIEGTTTTGTAAPRRAADEAPVMHSVDGSFEAWGPISRPEFADIGDLLARVTKKEPGQQGTALGARRPAPMPARTLPAAKKAKFTVQEDGVIDLTCDSD